MCGPRAGRDTKLGPPQPLWPTSSFSLREPSCQVFFFLDEKNKASKRQVGLKIIMGQQTNTPKKKKKTWTNSLKSVMGVFISSIPPGYAAGNKKMLTTDSCGT